MGIKRRGRRGPSRVIKQNPHRINGDIRGVYNVRLVGDNVQEDIYSFEEAMKMADDQELDLVEISANAKPPVCKILDYGKFLYDQNKKKKQGKKHQHTSELKELRFGPNISDHDLDIKIKKGKELLSKGDKVRASLLFKGRAIQHKERGEIVLLKFAQALEEVGVVEQMPKLEGKKMFLQITPKKK